VNLEMSKPQYKVVRITEATYNRIIKNAVYGDSFEDALIKALDKESKK
jgi:hypothetical protein